MKELLVVVPARAGSKGVPGKNKKLLAGKPLICYTLELALQLVPAHQILVSTDSAEIAGLAENMGIGVPALRPAELATDEAGMFPVLKYSLEQYKLQSAKKPEAVILLQPSSPFRRAEQVQQALALFSAETDMVASVIKTRANPYFVLFEEDEKGFLQKSKSLPGELNRRQDAPPVFELNGAIYIINPASLDNQESFAGFKQIRKFEMNELTSVDLDTELDWEFAEFLVNRNRV